MTKDDKLFASKRKRKSFQTEEEKDDESFSQSGLKITNDFPELHQQGKYQINFYYFSI